MKRILPYLIVAVFLSACSASKKATALWKPITAADQSAVPDVLPSEFGLYEIQIDLLSKSLKGVGANEEEGIIIQFPDPDGNVGNFKVWRSSVVSEALLEKYPNLRAYRGFNIADQSDIRMELPEAGLQVMVRNSGQAWFIAPYHAEKQLYMVYHKAAYPSDNQFWEGRIK